MAKYRLAVINPWRPERNPILNGYTGKLFEDEVLGTCRVKASGKMRFYRAFREVLHNQPWNPLKPTNHQTVVFHQAVARNMRELRMNPAQLKVFTAVGSALDRYHGIDGFFSFEGIVVTLDCTTNPHKDVSKARIIVREDDALDNGFRDSAREIAYRFKKALVDGLKGVI